MVFAVCCARRRPTRAPAGQVRGIPQDSTAYTRAGFVLRSAQLCRRGSPSDARTRTAYVVAGGVEHDGVPVDVRSRRCRGRRGRRGQVLEAELAAQVQLGDLGGAREAARPRTTSSGSRPASSSLHAVTAVPASRRPSANPLGSASSVPANRWPPRCVVSQVASGQRAASAAVTGRPVSAQHRSRRPLVQTNQSGAVVRREPRVGVRPCEVESGQLGDFLEHGGPHAGRVPEAGGEDAHARTGLSRRAVGSAEPGSRAGRRGTPGRRRAAGSRRRPCGPRARRTPRTASHARPARYPPSARRRAGWSPRSGTRVRRTSPARLCLRRPADKFTAQAVNLILVS